MAYYLASKSRPKNPLQYEFDNSSRLGSSTPEIRQLKLRTPFSDTRARLEKKEFGVVNHASPVKVIMVVGATGAGKTTLINGMVNYMFGVKWKDQCRYNLVHETDTGSQAHSQTKVITAYTIYHKQEYRVSYTLTIIDTPGFGDTGGIMKDKEITNQIKEFFSKPNFGITHINAICLVAQSSLARLTHTQKYIFDHILALFGRDIGENIFMMLTFADAQKPQILASLKAANMPYKAHYKFNNSALFANNMGDDDDEEHDSCFDEMFWKMGEKSFSNFMTRLNTVDSRSLTLTQKVLSEREKIQVNVQGIQMQIKVGLAELAEIEKTTSVLEQHRAEADANKNFEYQVEEIVIKKVDTPPGQFTTNCTVCNRTCHDNCIYQNDSEKRKCCAMSGDNCSVCPRKCHWSSHSNMPFVVVVETKTVKKTYHELKEKYSKAKGEMVSAADIMNSLASEFMKTQLQVMTKTEVVRKSIEHLKKIALKPDPLSSPEYIDILIEAEKADASSGWQNRVAQLGKIREEVVWMENVAKKGHDPFKKYQERIKRKTKGEEVAKALKDFGASIAKSAKEFLGIS